jgi:TatA/E family protein of Tat protein translocase
MVLAFLSDTGIAVVAVLVVVIFGGSQLPKLARNLGLAGKEFRRAHDAAESEAAAATPGTPVAAPAPPPSAVAAAPPAPPAAAPAPPPVAVPAPPAGTAPATGAPLASSPAAADDLITVSKSELAAFIEEREAQARRQANS